jgi:O-antigen ligase
MQTFFSEARVRWLSVFFSILIVAGIFLSVVVRILPSIGIAGLFVTSVGYSIAHRRIAQRAHWRTFLSFGLVYLLHASTGVAHAGDAGGVFVQDLVLQLPFLLLPIAFLLLPTWRETHLTTLWLVLIGCCLVAALGATVNYMLDYERIEQTYERSQVMPTVPDHIRFSLLISMAVLVGTVLLFKRALPTLWQWGTVGAVILLFVFQHLLAVRSGLMTMYAAGAVLLVWIGWQRTYRKALLLVLAGLVVLASSSFWLFPTLQKRIINTRHDIEQVASNEAANNYSITARVYSYRVAWAIIGEHPLLGVSKVKLNEVVASQYSYIYPQIEVEHYLLPHNQFLYNLAAYGSLGLLLFLVGFYYPLWVGLRARNIVLVLLYVVVSVSFLVEYTLETQIGILTGIFFILLASLPTLPNHPKRTSSLPPLAT